MVFSLPRLQGGNPVVQGQGFRPTAYFLSYVNDIAGRIETQEARQDTIDTQLQDAVADLATLTADLATTVAQVETLSGQTDNIVDNYIPMIDDHETRITDIEARLAAAGIP